MIISLEAKGIPSPLYISLTLYIPYYRNVYAVYKHYSLSLLRNTFSFYILAGEKIF